MKDRREDFYAQMKKGINVKDKKKKEEKEK